MPEGFNPTSRRYTSPALELAWVISATSAVTVLVVVAAAFLGAM